MYYALQLHSAASGRANRTHEARILPVIFDLILSAFG